jgi:hypothetical protein
MRTIIVLLATITAVHAQPVTPIRVSSLADSGPGSLRACVEASGGARACVFEVSGRIRLQSSLRLTRPETHILGQTAPSPGVLLTNAGVAVEADGCSVEHVAIRPGDGPSAQKPGERDALKVLADDVRVRGVSLSWATDENLSVYGERVTVTDSIIAEGLHRSIHPEGQHSMGALVGERSRRVVFQRNVLMSNRDRHVRWKSNTSGAMVNNVVYNWGGGTSGWNVNNVTAASTDLPILQDFVGNVYLPGPDTLSRNAGGFYADKGVTALGSWFFIRDNLTPTRPTGAEPEWAVANVAQSVHGVPVPLFEGHYPLPLTPATEALSAAVRHAGARPWDRSLVDLRLLGELVGRAGRIPDCVEVCASPDLRRVPEGGYPAVAENFRPLGALPEVFADVAAMRQWAAGFEGGLTGPVPTPTIFLTPGNSPTPTRTPTPRSTKTPTPTRTPTPRSTCTPTPTRTPTPTPTPTLRMCWLPCPPP